MKNKNTIKILMALVLISAILTGFLFFGYGYLEKIVAQAETNLKIGVVTDVEFANRKRIGNKLPKEGKIQLERIVEIFNNDFQPEIVVEVGDMIESSTNRTTKSAQSTLREINEIFSRIRARKEYVLGNHDLRALNKQEFREVVGMEDNHKFFDLGDWRFVIMDTNFDDKGNDLGPTFYAGSYVSEKEFLWLEEALKTDRPTIVFSHHPPLPLAKKNMTNGEEALAFFEKFKNVVMVVSGHHPNFEFNEMGGIRYIVVDNIANVDSVGSYATLETKYNKFTKVAEVKLEHYGPKRETREFEKKLEEVNPREVLRSAFFSLVKNK